MTHRSRRLLTLTVAVAATLGLVGVSGALEGEDPTLGDPEVTCQPVADGAADDGAGTSDGTATSDGATESTDDSGVTDEAGDEGDEDAACAEPAPTDTEGSTEEEAPDDAVTGEDAPVAEDTTDGDAAPETDEVANHGAAVSQAADECPPGPDHGPCVREVAQSDAGKKAKGTDEAPEEEVDSTEGEADASDDASEEGDEVGDEVTVTGKGHGAGKAKHSR